ncbi:MAG: B12-binding domain-containing radical SAM protein, partial [Nitrospina sp.]|nr:B12-binding domain-containing radical SAM protein [Nitrospina sp.]
DHFVIGEGEKALVKILNNEISAKIIDPVLLKSVLEDDNAFIDFKKAPIPNYGDLEINKYLQLSVSSSRGCPFECSFCAETVFWEGFRSNTASSVYNQIDSLAKKYKRSSFYICDSLTNHIITPLAQEIKDNNKPYTLDCYLRADKVCTQEKRTKAWREGGLFRARLGMESASQRILDDMIKNTTPENMEMSLYALSKHGILTSTLWIIAYPGETENEFKETLKFIKDSSAHIYQSDPWLFQYHPVGLSKSDKISSEKGSKARFSNYINEILSVAPYHVDQDLSQEERFGRLERFTCEMEELELLNPYSVTDILKAEKRFSGLNSGKSSGWDPLSSMKKLAS